MGSSFGSSGAARQLIGSGDTAFATVAAFLADTTMTNANTAEGDVVVIPALGIAYTRAAAAATDHDVTTNSSVKWYVEPTNDAYQVAAWGLVPASTDAGALINAAIAKAANNDGPKKVCIPAGTFTIEETISIWSDSGFKTVHLAGVPAGMFLGTTKLVHKSDQLTNPLIAIQATRTPVVSDLYLKGNNAAPAANGGASGYRNHDPADYVTSGCQDSDLAPYAGIAIDHYSRSLPAATEDRYTFKSTSDYGAGTSSGVQVNNVRIEGFVVGLAQLAHTGSEGHVYSKCRFIENKFGWTSSNSQERYCQLLGCDFNGNWCAVDTITYGEQSGVPPEIIGGNYSKHYRLLQIGGSIDVFSMQGGYAEDLAEIGILGNGTTTAIFPATFDGCDFSIIGHKDTSSDQAKDTPIVADMPTGFYGCALSCNWNMLVAGAHPVTFETTGIRLVGDGVTAAEDAGFQMTGATGLAPISSKNSYLRTNTGGTNPVCLDDEFRFQSQPNRQRLQPNTTRATKLSDGTSYVLDTRPAGYGREITNISNIVHLHSYQLTFDYIAADDRPLMVGDVLKWPVLEPTANGGAAATPSFPALRVQSIVSGTVTCEILSRIDTTATPTTAEVVAPRFALKSPPTGDTTSGSAIITNVSATGNIEVGDWIYLEDPGADLHTQLRVESKTSNTITVHRTMNESNTGLTIENTILRAL